MGIVKTETKKTLKTVGTIAFFIFSGLLVLYILLELFIPDMTIKVFQFKPYVVLTESMEPVIDVDDMVIVWNPNPDKLEVGDIITFKADIDYNGTKETVTHYIHTITENNDGDRIFRTNRYGSTTPDTWILRDSDIIGVYGFRIRQLGVLVNFIKSPFGIAAVSVNLIVIGAIVYLVKSGKKEKIEKVETTEI
ncbi:MAG: signal peptidase I [Tenericutes bacterium HGW-Tenericutes-2]|nr:MAG: signal peptidase I [Tenericutes bacterium HGW-Tenericutes-2]